MGYESKIYVVEKVLEKSKFYEGEEKRYAEIIAVFNMRCFPAFNGVFTKETDCYVYADDGNTHILEDQYGEPLKEASVESVIDCLEKNNIKGHYRRVVPLLNLLKGFDQSEWRNLTVLHFGY